MFDGDELELALGSIATGLFTPATEQDNDDGGDGDEGAVSHHATTNGATMNATSVLRYLVQLVCQSMTHLLHTEVCLLYPRTLAHASTIYTLYQHPLSTYSFS